MRKAAFPVIEGAPEVQVVDIPLPLDEADTACVPGFSRVTLRNPSPDRPAFLFIVDETPLHQKLGVFEHRGLLGRDGSAIWPGHLPLNASAGLHRHAAAIDSGQWR